VQEVIDGLAILNALLMTWTRNMEIDRASFHRARSAEHVIPPVRGVGY
jgi:hypothetical protein